MLKKEESLMDRRNFIKTSGISALCAVATTALAETAVDRKQKTYMLVQGTWLGG